MNSNLWKTLDGNMVKTTMFFEPAKDTLDGNTLVVEHLPFGSFLNQSLLMGRVGLEDRFTTILESDEAPERVTGIASVGHDELAM